MKFINEISKKMFEKIEILKKFCEKNFLDKNYGFV